MLDLQPLVSFHSRKVWKYLQWLDACLWCVTYFGKHSFAIVWQPSYKYGLFWARTLILYLRFSGKCWCLKLAKKILFCNMNKFSWCLPQLASSKGLRCKAQKVLWLRVLRRTWSNILCCHINLVLDWRISYFCAFTAELNTLFMLCRFAKPNFSCLLTVSPEFKKVPDKSPWRWFPSSQSY